MKSGILKGKYAVPIILFIVSLLLEIFLFNFRFYESLGYVPQQLNNPVFGSGFVAREANVYDLVEGATTITFEDIGIPVNNLYVGLTVDGDPNVPITVTTSAISASSSVKYVQGARTTIVGALEESKIYHSYFGGDMYTLELEIGGLQSGQFLRFEKVEVNVPVPFRFSLGRLLVVFGAFLFLWTFRPKSPIYHFHFGKARPLGRNKRIVVAAVLTVNFVAVAFSATSVNSIRETVFSNNEGQYQDLAASLADGRFDLGPASPELQAMENPYDSSARVDLGVDFPWDYAYYEGYLYSYFGVVPVLLFHLPVYLLTGKGLSNVIPLIAFGCMLVAGIYLLLYQIVRQKFERISFAIYMMAAQFTVFCSGTLFLVQRYEIYRPAILSGLAFVVMALALWLTAVQSGKVRRVPLMLGSLCMALVAGCRPQMLVYAFLAVPIFWPFFKGAPLKNLARRWKDVVLFILPVIPVALFLMYYNYARFGSVLDFGAVYNLTTNDMTHRGFAPTHIVDALVYFFLQPPGGITQFPFLNVAYYTSGLVGTRIWEDMYGGLLGTYPMLWILLLAGVYKNKLKERGFLLPFVYLVAAGVIVGVLDAQMAGILYRYMGDFAFALCTAATLLIFTVQADTYTENALQNGRPALCLNAFVQMGLFLCVIFTALLFFTNTDGYLRLNNSILYNKVRCLVEFWS